MRLVSRKLMSSCSNMRSIWVRSVMVPLNPPGKSDSMDIGGTTTGVLRRLAPRALAASL